MAPFKIPTLPIATTDLSWPSWIAVGAIIHTVMIQFLPLQIAILPFVLFLLSRLASTLAAVFGFTKHHTTGTRFGRLSAEMPLQHKNISSVFRPPNEGVTVFMFGARINHPFGRFAPGFAKMYKMFTAMIKEASQNRLKYGYLSRSSALVAEFEEGGLTLVWLSYFKTLEGLRLFAASEAHKTSWNAYLKDKAFPYIGIMHETYQVPTGSWESIYHNFQPFEMGRAKVPVEKDLDKELADAVGSKMTSFREILTEAKGPTTDSMFKRMGKI